MSQKPGIEESQGELSWEEAVLRFLEAEPDFFARHPDLFGRIALRHEVGGAVSLIEYQVQTLRARNAELHQQWRELVNVARENDALSLRLHRFACAMVGAHGVDEVIDAAADLLRHEFRIDTVSMRLLRDPAGARPEYVGAQDRRLRELLTRFDGGKPLLDALGDESLRRYLFADQADNIRSGALVALGGPTPEGVLALGAHEAARFYPGMGTLYLSRLGELLGRALAAAPA